MKKRHLETGNKKYFGDDEDVQQSNFIKAIFDNITKHLRTPDGVHLNDFHRLLVSFDLPINFHTL